MNDNADEINQLAKHAYILSYWIMISRDLCVMGNTMYHCIKIGRRERHRIQTLQDRATPQTHLIDLKMLFESVMPRAYFIMFLNEKNEEEYYILDCLDLY